MKDRSQEEQRNRRNKASSSARYRFLLPSDVQMPEMPVDAKVWDRIVDGLPKRYVLPDRTFMEYLEKRVKASGLKRSKRGGN